MNFDTAARLSDESVCGGGKLCSSKTGNRSGGAEEGKREGRREGDSEEGSVT